MLAILLVAGVVIILMGIAFLAILIATAESASGELLPAERFYPTLDRSTQLFPEPYSSWDARDGVYLSVIAPAYNEEERIHRFFDDAMPHLEKRSKEDSTFTYEIIVVDDGSKDKTNQKVMEQCKKYGTDKIRLLKLVKNRGKGGAVRRGFSLARGKYLLFADSDGATLFSDIDRLEKKLKTVEKNGYGIAVGSRKHLQEEAEANRTLLRNCLMWGLHILLYYVGGITTINDTQCGFKLFTRKAAHKIFPQVHVERWAFDIELLYLAGHFSIPAVEVPVNWEEIEGSKLNPFFASIEIARDLFRIRLYYLSGVWKISNASREKMD